MAVTINHQKTNLVWRVFNVVKPFAIRILLFSIICLANTFGTFESRNLALMDLRFQVLNRDPSNSLVIVEIDPLSLKSEEHWPWSRDQYAKAITNLQRAGASLIALDVDFSSLSDDEGDAALIAALSQRPGEVILPVFSQWSSRGAENGVLVESPPHPFFLQDSIVASVNLTTEKNGMVRRGWRGFEDDDGAFRASIAATLAGIPGARQEPFYIDYSIDLSKIERISFSDVLSGNFLINAVKGKNILIGATAVELGDEFAAPNLGVTPGVMLHALSYETLRQGRIIKRLHYYIPLFAAFLIIVWTCRKRNRKEWKKTIREHTLLFAGLFAIPIFLQAYALISFDVWVMIAAQAIAIIYMVGVTLRKHAHQLIKQRSATARYQELTNLVVRDNTDGVIVANAKGVIELCSVRANQLLRVEGGAGDSIHDVAPGFPLCFPDNKTSVYTADAANYEPPILCEYVVEGDDGLTLEIIASCSKDNFNLDARSGHENNGKIIVYTLRDISARKRIEVAEKEARQAAVAANKFKSELIANMSHELRTPLNGVIGFADILQKEAFGPLGMPEYKDYSENIYVSGKRLLGLVNDMLNVARLDSGDYEICKAHVAVCEIIDDCLGENEICESKKVINVDVQKDLPEIHVDYTIFKEILSHLLSNSIKYTDDNAKISIFIFQHGDDLVVEVKDNGCGVDSSLLPILTKAFYQGDGALSRQHEGAGLGLYIASRFAELHDGATLEFESEKDAGFLARLRFPEVVTKQQKSAA